MVQVKKRDNGDRGRLIHEGEDSTDLDTKSSISEDDTPAPAINASEEEAEDGMFSAASDVDIHENDRRGRSSSKRKSSRMESRRDSYAMKSKPSKIKMRTVTEEYTSVCWH